MLSPQVQDQYPSYGYTPVRTDLLTAAYQKANPLDAVALAALQAREPATWAPRQPIDQPVSGALPEMFDKAVYQGQLGPAITARQAAVTAAMNAAK